MQPENQDEGKISTGRLLIEELKAEELQNPPNLRIKNCRMLKVKVLHFFQAVNLREFNDLLTAAANVVGKLVGYKRRTNENKQKLLCWKFKFKSQIKNIRKDISWIEDNDKEKVKKIRSTRSNKKKVSYQEYGLKVVIEESKQKVMAKAAKIK